MANPSDVRLIPDCKVSVDGNKLDLEKDAALTRVDVDLDVDLFGQCVLTFNDPKLALINGTHFKSGIAVKVEIGFHTALKKVFEGEVVALEPVFRRDSPPSLRVVCQESLHRLALSQMTRAFNDVDDKEIATKIAQAHGLSAEAPAGTKEHVLQGNVTDAAFLRRLAAKQGNALRLVGKKLIIGPPPKGADVQVSPGDGLRKITIQIKANTQVGEVSVHGWDAKTKKEIVAKAKPQGPMQEGAKKHGNKSTLSIAGNETIAPDTATAEAMAKGRLRKIAEGFIQAHGEMIGNPGVVPGAVLKLDKISAQIDGQYRVEHAAHAFSKHGYSVKFRAVRIAGAKPPPAKVEPKTEKAPEREPPTPDVHLIHLEVKSIGGTPLPHHHVRVLDAATGKQVGEIVTTDDKGIMRAEVPDPAKKYRVEILDDGIEGATPPQHTDGEPAVLFCEFLDESGGPVADEAVEATVDGDKLELRTDESGRIDAPARHAVHELKIKGQTFHAHAVALADRDKEGSLYRFVLGEPRDVHLIAVEVKGLGGTPLPRHKVRLLDPDTGVPIDDWTETDADGVLRAQVPDERTYRIEILDDSVEAPPPDQHVGDGLAVLLCHFVDGEGAPLADEPVEVKSGEETMALRTDAEGRIDSPAHLGGYELKVREHNFTAHAIPLADRAKEETLYRFVVGEPRDVHLIAVEVRSLGGTLLADHKVRVLDPETGEPVTDWLKTDASGVLRTQVPDDRTYRIEIADEETQPAAQPEHHVDQPPAVLFCHFVDGSGTPIANERVQATRGGDTFELFTDEEGRIDDPAQLGDYQLKIKRREFTAHALPLADRESSGGYRFVIEESKG